MEPKDLMIKAYNTIVTFIQSSKVGVVTSDLPTDDLSEMKAAYYLVKQPSVNRQILSEVYSIEAGNALCKQIEDLTYEDAKKLYADFTDELVNSINENKNNYIGIS